MIAVETAQGLGGRTLHLQQIVAEREPRGHLRERAGVRIVARGIESAERRKDLLAGIHTDAARRRLRGRRGLLGARRENDGGAQSGESSQSRENRALFENCEHTQTLMAGSGRVKESRRTKPMKLRAQDSCAASP